MEINKQEIDRQKINRQEFAGWKVTNRWELTVRETKIDRIQDILLTQIENATRTVRPSARANAQLVDDLMAHE